MDAVLPLKQVLQDIQERLQALESQVGIQTQGGIQKEEKANSISMSQPLPKSVEAYDDYTSQCLVPFLDASKKLGSEVTKLADIIERAFNSQRQFLLMASQCKKPTSAEVMKLLVDIQTCSKEMNELRDNRSPWCNHQNAVSEGIQGLGWLCVEPAPRPFIESYIGGSDFWSNKIRVQYKASNPDQIAFASTFKDLLEGLRAYVKEYHTTGVTWNPQGVSTSSYVATSSTIDTTSGSGKGGSNSTTTTTTSTIAGGGNMNSVFAGIRSIDQSSGKTAGLKTVTKDMQTWRKEYKGGDSSIPAGSASSTFKKTSKSNDVQDKPLGNPVCSLVNDKWVIENQSGETPVTVQDINMRQQVYVFRCQNATILLEGKAKTIVMDNCKNTKLIFQNVVSSVEIVNCKRVQVQCKGIVPSVSIDKTDGILVYVSYEGRDVQFVTSKSSEMNVAFPSSSNSDDFVEKPIPEQFIHKIVEDGKISSDVSDLYSS